MARHGQTSEEYAEQTGTGVGVPQEPSGGGALLCTSSAALIAALLTSHGREPACGRRACSAARRTTCVLRTPDLLASLAMPACGVRA